MRRGVHLALEGFEITINSNHHRVVSRHQWVRGLEDTVKDVYFGSELFLQGHCPGDGLEMNLYSPHRLVRYYVLIVEGSHVYVCGYHPYSYVTLSSEGCPH